MSLSRKIERKQMLNTEKAVEKGEMLTEAQKRYPTGQIITAPIKGEFTTFPLLGWVALRAQEQIPLVMLALALLKGDKICGTLHMEIPIYEGETDKAALAALKRYGWNGQVWKPGDEHWPTGDAANEEQVQQLLNNANLRATLTFPPDAETGDINAQTVEVLRAKGPFFMQPLPESEEEPDPQELEAFINLCRNVAQFHRLN